MTAKPFSTEWAVLAYVAGERKREVVHVTWAPRAVAAESARGCPLALGTWPMGAGRTGALRAGLPQMTLLPCPLPR